MMTASPTGTTSALHDLSRPVHLGGSLFCILDLGFLCLIFKTNYDDVDDDDDDDDGNMVIMRLVSVSYGWPGAVDALAHWLTLLSLRSFLFCFKNTLLLYFVLKIHFVFCITNAVQ